MVCELTPPDCNHQHPQDRSGAIPSAQGPSPQQAKGQQQRLQCLLLPTPSALGAEAATVSAGQKRQRDDPAPVCDTDRRGLMRRTQNAPSGHVWAVRALLRLLAFFSVPVTGLTSTEESGLSVTPLSRRGHGCREEVACAGHSLVGSHLPSAGLLLAWSAGGEGPLSVPRLPWG